MKRVYLLRFRDSITYVNREKYQSLREAVNALLHSEKVELPRTPDEAFEFDKNPGSDFEDFTDTKFDRMDAAAQASSKPNREAAKSTEQVITPEPDPAPAPEPPSPDQ